MNRGNKRIRWAQLVMIITSVIFTLILLFVLVTAFSRNTPSGRFIWNAPDSIQPIHTTAP